MASRKDIIMLKLKELNDKEKAQTENEVLNTAIRAENVFLVDESGTLSNFDLNTNDLTEMPNLSLDIMNSDCVNVGLLPPDNQCIQNQSFSDICLSDGFGNLNLSSLNSECDQDFFVDIGKNAVLETSKDSQIDLNENLQLESNEKNNDPMLYTADVQEDDLNCNIFSSEQLEVSIEHGEKEENIEKEIMLLPVNNLEVEENNAEKQQHKKGKNETIMKNAQEKVINKTPQFCIYDDTFLPREMDPDDPDYEPSLSDESSEDENRRDPPNVSITDNEVLPTPLRNREADNENNVQVVEKGKRKRRKRQHVKEEDWFVNRNKAAREKGKPYSGKILKNGKWSYDVPKGERKMKERCQCKLKNKNQIKCDLITDEDRVQIFKKFWNMSWQEKKVYLDLFVMIRPTSRARGRKDVDTSRREHSYIYFLEKNQEKMRVCKKMFFGTIGIGEKAMRNWKKTSTCLVDDQQEENVDEVTSQENLESNGVIKYRKISESRKKKFESSNEGLDTFFKSLAKVESHYCRKNSSKLYLEPNWTSKQELYREYCRWSEERNVTTMSIAKFLNVFEEQNLSLFKPKKDECDICVGHRTGNVSEEFYSRHIDKKKEARDEKEKDKSSDKSLVFTMDLQCVLLCPKSNVSSLYYKTKLAVHNLSFYNLKTKEVHCYVWNESEGGLTANEFTSIICDFILKQCPLPGNIESIILYSDGCTYQNRNAILSNGLVNLAKLMNITIEQKFLEKGHTQMEADSVHSQIERQVRNKIINVPADYVPMIEKARTKPNPYLVSYLDHTFFKNYESLKYFKSIRPGKKVGDPCVTDIRALKYNKEGLMYKLRFGDEYNNLPVRTTVTAVEATMTRDIPILYKDRLKIKKRKYEDLQELKKTIPVDYHHFYDNLLWQ